VLWSYSLEDTKIAKNITNQKRKAVIKIKLLEICGANDIKCKLLTMQGYARMETGNFKVLIMNSFNKTGNIEIARSELY